jgi:TRAP-type mannitol/chloroaromatic compound transport system permease small subunit
MPKILKLFVRIVDAVNYRIGRATMYGFFLLLGVLLYSSFMKTFFNPSLWTLEVAQFVMAAYFILGGAYALQLDDHVRMDLLYGNWSERTKTWVDIFTILCLIFYLFWMLYGGISSTQYAIHYNERSYSSWRPYMWPIKVVMTFGMLMMLLQSVSILIKDIAKLRGEEI